ncbi:MAG: sugar transferase [Patescibacteria group bacterium]|jgi:exopolysaccharide biosynthesis polyprenyl glycosylphosphotransferase|nr:sugar transferase [Patescibacteria group bacterium]
MKKSELFFSALQIPVDYIMLVLAGFLAFILRSSESITGLKPILYDLSIREYMQIILIVAAFFVLVFAIEGLYVIKATRKFTKSFYRVSRAIAIGLMIIIIGIFINREWYSSRFVILLGGILAIVLVSSARISLGYIQRYLLKKKGTGVHRLVLVGSDGVCKLFKNKINKNRFLGFKIVGVLDSVDFGKIKELKKMKGIDELIACSPSSIKKNELHDLKKYCMYNRIAFKYVPTLIETANFDLQIFLGEPLIEVKNTPLDGWGKILKRVFDLIGSIVGIILFSPIMLVTAIVTWIDSGRPIIYFNPRVGHRGTFNLFKFRYMKPEYSHGEQFSENHNKKAIKYLDELIKKQSIKKGPIYKIKNDPRKTKFGKFIERFSIDELPQFFNVFKGNMSLVGPRPHQPIEVDKYRDYHLRVLTIKPGITGMAQISGRSDLDFEDEVRLDTYYIENWSLWLDIQIIIKTIPSLFRKRKN